jgi:hypothetical protein
MTGSKDRLKRAKAVTIVEQMCRARVCPGKANQLLAGFTRIQGKITGEEARFSPAHGKLDTGNLLNDGVYRSNVIHVRMRQSDTPDRRIETPSSLQDGGSRTSKSGIDESKSIVFADEKAIDHSEASQPKKIFGFFG